MVKNEFKRQSLLWKISASDLEHSSYLFGTMHLIPKKDFAIRPKVLQVLKKCDELFLELNLTNEKDMVFAQQSMISNNLISEFLTNKEVLELKRHLKNFYKISLEEVDHLSPMMLMNKLTGSLFEEEELLSIEIELINAAFMNDIKVRGLETVKAQIKIARKIFTPKELLRQIRLGDDYKNVMQSMVSTYKQEDITALHLLVKDRRFMTEEAEKLLVKDRNASWSRKIPKLLATNKKIFFAVGAGHLGGEKGIISLLRKKGFRITPLKC